VRGQNEPPRPVGEPIANIKSPPPADASGNATDEKVAAGTGAPNFAPPPEQPINRAAGPTGLTVATAPGPQVKLNAAPPPPPAGAQPQPAPVQSAPAQPPAAPAPHKDQAAKAAPTMRAAEQFGPDGKAPTAIKTPAPRPEAPIKVAKAEPAPKPVPVQPAPVKAAPAKTVAEKPAPAKPAPAKPAAAAPAPVKSTPAKPASGGGVVVQVGAYVSTGLAEQGYDKVAGLMGGKMGGHGRRVEPVAVGGTTRYRSQVTGFATRAEATAFCVALKAKGHDCIVKAPE
jgi:hypothetical protein